MSRLSPILEWLARLAGLVVAGGFVLILVAEFTQPHSAPPSTLTEWSGIILLTAASAGMLLAWRWELPGAVVSVAAIVTYALLIRTGRPGVLFVFAMPGILFLADWLWRRQLDVNEQ